MSVEFFFPDLKKKEPKEERRGVGGGVSSCDFLDSLFGTSSSSSSVRNIKFNFKFCRTKNDSAE